MSAAADKPDLVRVKAVRMGARGIEGLVELSDGTEEWREPSMITATGTITRADGTVEHSDLQIGGEGCTELP